MAFYDVGNKIREYRIKAGINQDQLAELASLNRVTVAKYETGRIEPGAQALARIADALGVSADALLGRSDQDEETTIRLPITPEARIVSAGMDKMPQEARETILSVVRAMYQKDHPELFDEKEVENNDA